MKKQRKLMGCILVAMMSFMILTTGCGRNAQEESTTETPEATETPATEAEDENTEEQDLTHKNWEAYTTKTPTGEEPAVAEGTSFSTKGLLLNFLDHNELEVVAVYVNEEATKVTIPSHFDYEGYGYPITSIGAGAFSECQMIEEINLPDTITNVGTEAFKNTAWYQKQTEDMLIVGDSVLAAYKGSDTEVTIPDTVKHIGAAFLRNKEITSVTIPESVTEIGDYAFYYCTALKEIHLPTGITEIGEHALEGTRMVLTSTEDMIVANQVLLAYTGTETQVTVPDGITMIAGSAFTNAQVTKVTLPESVTQIGDGAFSYCLSLEEVNIPSSVKKIGKHAFICDEKLKSVVLPNGLESLGISAFQGCTALSDVILPSSLTDVGMSVFTDCTSMKKISLSKEWKALVDAKALFLTNTQVEYVEQ